MECTVGTDPRVMTPLPNIYLKCTSMIMDPMNFSIDYASPFTSAFLQSSYNQLLIQRTLGLKSQVAPSGCDSKSKILHQKVNLRSDVKMTLQYLGAGFSITNEIINPKDEVSMFQQICGGESLCVFKGYLSPGDTFQVLSRRHYGFPFSASIYINGLIAARISWCCEFRHPVGFQQGRRSCFRITQLSGGQPCYRCANFHMKYQTRPRRKESSGSTKGGSITGEEKTDMAARNTETNTWEPPNICSAPPNTQPIPPMRRKKRRKKKILRKEESDSEQENKEQKKHGRRWRDSRSGRRRRSFSEKISSSGAERWSTAQGERPHLEEEPEDTVQAIHRRLATAISELSAHSEVELSDSSESSDNPSSMTGQEQSVAAESEEQVSGGSVEDEGLLCQVADLMAVLQECDEIHQLVLRNTGLTDPLLLRLASAIMASKSEVETINLNLNEIGPGGAKTLVGLLRRKPSITSLLLYGNQLGAAGVRTLMAGLCALWRPDRGASSLNSSGLRLSELDIGGNQMESDGLRSVAAFLKLNPPLRQLCLAHSSVTDMVAWEELFEVMKVNTNVTHLLLDDNGLGDRGAALVSALIQVNHSLLSLDLDDNDIGEEGGRAIIGSLGSGSPLTNISLENNPISAHTINAIKRALLSQTTAPNLPQMPEDRHRASYTPSNM
ncbi:uncharacterized protein [Dendropsophus ebraccatus]|uniref:uncharacterized protein n=1 Tax=Dendropsophus ebraccatus TaxID=150705 RepID=UPI0038313C2B